MGQICSSKDSDVEEKPQSRKDQPITEKDSNLPISAPSSRQQIIETMVEQTQSVEKVCASFQATSNANAITQSPINNNEFEPYGVQGSFKNRGQLYNPKQKWGLVGMIYDAYNTHHELVLRPDDFWQAIVTQFSFYVNANSEALRDRIVDFEGKKELVVVTEGNFLTVDYGNFASRMVSEQIVKNIKDPAVAEWLQPNFSTTTETDKVAASVSIMATLQNYFTYTMMTCCGLPKVTMLGKVEDWVQLRAKIDKLQDFDVNGDMNKWHAYLVQIMDKLVESAQGKQCMDFWDKVLSNIQGGSGEGPHITGWAAVFCCFDRKGKWRGKERMEWSFDEPSTECWPYVDQDEIPTGVCSVPVKVDDNGTEYQTQMSAGHFAFETEKMNTVIRPSIDWLIELKEDHEKRRQKECSFDFY